MKARRRNDGNQYLHRASPKYRDDVKRKLHAYHVFIQTGLICQGLLQDFSVDIPGSSGPPSDPGYAPSDPGSRPPNSSSQPRYASGFLNCSWIPRKTTSSRNSSPNEPIPIKCRASNSQLERKFWANPRILKGDVVPVDFVSGALPHCVALPLGPQQESLLGCDGLLVEPLDRAPCFCMGSIAPRGAAGSRPPITSPASSPPAMARYKGHRANRRFRPLHW